MRCCLCVGPSSRDVLRSTLPFAASPPLVVVTPGVEGPKEGRALSLALSERNKKRGTAQTKIAKKAATSMNAGPVEAIAVLPYRYFGCLYLFASLARFAKWKNHAKWSATTSTQLARNFGEVSDM